MYVPLPAASWSLFPALCAMRSGLCRFASARIGENLGLKLFAGLAFFEIHIVDVVLLKIC